MSLTVSRRSHTGDPSSITGPVRVRYVVDTVVLGHDFLCVLHFILAIFVLPMFHGHLHLHVVLTKERRMMLFQKSTGIGQKCTSMFYVLLTVYPNKMTVFFLPT